MRILALIALFSLALASTAMAQPTIDEGGEAAMLSAINELRAQNQLPPLARSSALDAVARAHAVDMAGRNELGHVSPTTGTPADRVQSAGLNAGYLAENVAVHRDSAQAQSILEASSGHRANMLHPNVTQIGIGAIRSGADTYVTQLFTDGASASAPAQTPNPPAPDTPAATPAPSAPVLIPPFVPEAQAANPPADPESTTDCPPAEGSATAQPETNPAPPTTTPVPTPNTTPRVTLRGLADAARSFLRALSVAPATTPPAPTPVAP